MGAPCPMHWEARRSFRRLARSGIHYHFYSIKLRVKAVVGKNFFFTRLIHQINLHLPFSVMMIMGWTLPFRVCCAHIDARLKVPYHYELSSVVRNLKIPITNFPAYSLKILFLWRYWRHSSHLKHIFPLRHFLSHYYYRHQIIESSTLALAALSKLHANFSI